MSRPIHAIPLLASGPHLPNSACPCRPSPAVDLLEPARSVWIHGHLPTRPEAAGAGRLPPEECA